MLCLEWNSNPHLWHSRSVCYHVGSLMSPLYPHPPVCAAPCLRCQCRLRHSSLWNCKSFNAYNYKHTGTDLMQGKFNKHTTHSLYRIMITATCVVGDMKMGNIVPKAGIKHTNLSFRPVCYHYPM